MHQFIVKTCITVFCIAVLSSCRVVDVHIGVQTEGVLENLNGQPIDGQSFSLCLTIKYNVEGSARSVTRCSSALSDHDGKFKSELSWKTQYRADSAAKVMATDYGISVGGVPESAIEMENKPSVSDLISIVPSEGPIPTSKASLKIRIKADPSDLEIATIWHQADLLNDYPNRLRLLNDFLDRYESRLSLDQVLRLSEVLQNVSNADGGIFAYRDDFLMHFHSLRSETLSSDDLIKLSRKLGLEKNRKTVLGL